MKQLFGITTIALGVLSAILFFYTGIKFLASGNNLQELRSIGGTSVAEAYYQEVGKQGVAHAMGNFAFGVAVLSLSCGLGAQMLAGGKSNI